MRQLALFLCMAVLFPVSALAASDIVATYTYSDGSKVTLVTRDESHVRLDTTVNSYLLLSNSKVYSVSCDDGQCQAMDMAAMMGMVSGSMFDGGEADYEVRYQDTGRSEVVAGYKGNIYTVITFEDGKEIDRTEVVLGSHTNIRKLSKGWLALASTLTQTMGETFKESLDEASKMGYGGVLRYGDSMRLSKLSVKNLNASYYQLPANTQQTKAPAAPTQAGSSMSGSSDSELEQDAAEIGRDAKETTKQEIKEDIRDMIGNIFN